MTESPLLYCKTPKFQIWYPKWLEACSRRVEGNWFAQEMGFPMQSVAVHWYNKAAETGMHPMFTILVHGNPIRHSCLPDHRIPVRGREVIFPYTEHPHKYLKPVAPPLLTQSYCHFCRCSHPPSQPGCCNWLWNGFPEITLVLTHVWNAGSCS